MDKEYLNKCRDRMIDHPDLLYLFDLAIDTIDKLGITIDDLKQCKSDNRWKKYAHVIELTNLFDKGSIPPRAGAVEFLVDYFHVYHYDI